VAATTTGTDLLTALRAGDPGAFEQMLRANGSWMLGLARRILGDDAEAEDAVQDACLCAFRALDAFRGQASLETWLHRIVVNAALMRLRTRRRRDEALLDGPVGAPFSERGRAPRFADGSFGPEGELERAEVLSLVRRGVEGLPPAYRAVLVLRDVEGLSMPEVADLLDLSVAGAKSRLHRARQALRVRLLDLFADPEDRVAI